MEFRPPPIQESPIDGMPKFTQRWVLWFSAIFDFLTGDRPIKLHEVTVATLPPADENLSAIIYVSDEVGGAIVAFSDGSDWRRVSDRAVVS